MPAIGKDRILRIEKRKKLAQLFARGEYICFDDKGNAVLEEDGQWSERLWVASPNPFQRDEAMREGTAARARVQLDARENSGSRDWVSVRAFISNLTDDELNQFLLNSKEQERLGEARREVLEAPEWDDFNALRDAMRQFEEAGSPQDNPEWTALMEREIEFGRQIVKRAADLRETAEDSYKMIPRAKREADAIDVRIDNNSAAEFVAVYENWMMFFSVRDEKDHDVLFFDTLQEYLEMPRIFQNAVAGTLARYITESSEAKN